MYGKVLLFFSIPGHFLSFCAFLKKKEAEEKFPDKASQIILKHFSF